MKNTEHNKHIIDIPFNESVVEGYLNLAGFNPLLSSPDSDDRARVDAIVQAYIDRQSTLTEQDQDNVEDTIAYLIGRVDEFPRKYDSGMDAIGRLVTVRDVGARALHDQVSTVGVPSTEIIPHETTEENIKTPEETALFDSIDQLADEGRVSEAAAKYLRELFGPDHVDYSISHHENFSRLLGILINGMHNALNDQPKTKKHGQKVYLDPQLQEGMDVFEGMKTILGLSKSEPQHPFTKYLGYRERKGHKDADRAATKNEVLSASNHALRIAFRLGAVSSSE